MHFHDAYVGLGGNIGDTVSIMRSALSQICSLEGVHQVAISSFYETSPVSSIPQSSYTNAVCRLKTTLTPHELLTQLQRIERMHGKEPKPKEAPRILDLDILLFGSYQCRDKELEIPHPRWRERLFVLMPLSDLTSSIAVPCFGQEDKVEFLDIFRLIQALPSRNCEEVKRL